MKKVFILKDENQIEYDDLSDIIVLFPKLIRSRLDDITDLAYKRKSIIGYLMLVKYIKDLTGNFYFPNYFKKTSDNNLDFYFSISHSKNYYALAISDEEVGLDIEEPREFSPNLKKKLNCTSNIEVLIEWTKRESRFKLDNNYSIFDSDLNQFSYDINCNEIDKYVLTLATKK